MLESDFFDFNIQVHVFLLTRSVILLIYLFFSFLRDHSLISISCSTYTWYMTYQIINNSRWRLCTPLRTVRGLFQQGTEYGLTWNRRKKIPVEICIHEAFYDALVVLTHQSSINVTSCIISWEYDEMYEYHVIHVIPRPYCASYSLLLQTLVPTVYGAKVKNMNSLMSHYKGSQKRNWTQHYFAVIKPQCDVLSILMR